MSVTFKLFTCSLLILIAILGLLSLPVGAVTTGGIGGRPAHPDPANPRSKSIFIFTTKQGEVTNDAVLVSNNSNERKTIEIYAVDGIVTNTGAYTCAQQSEARLDVGTWVSLSRDKVTLDPGKMEEVAFTLTAPRNADVGEHNGCIVFQSAEDDGEMTGNVRIRTRQAIRVVATIPGNLQRDVAIQHFNLSQQSGQQIFNLSLQNTGNVSADVDAKVLLTSLFGTTVYQNGGGYPVLAGQKLDLTYTNEKRPLFGGWFYTQAKIRYDKRAGSFGVGRSVNAITRESQRRLIFVTPRVEGLAIIVLILGLVGAVLYFSLRRQVAVRDILVSGEDYSVVKGDTIQTVADKHGMDWQKLASLNGIPAPYVLKKGTVLKVSQRQATAGDKHNGNDKSN